MSDTILTVICLVYNHENYLRKCLESMVTQNTKYKYKVLVHDDASTDNSKDIILEYQKIYPDIIIPYIEKTNLWSKGIIFFNMIDEKTISSKYIAFCEGDDFWTSDKKIETQINFLESHSEYSGITHNTEVIDETGEVVSKICGWNTDKDISELNSLLFFPHTSSYVCKNPWISTDENVIAQRKYFKWDKNIAIYMLSIGKVHYMKDIMSCYRHIRSYGTSTEYMEKNFNMTIKKIDMEYDLYNHLKEVNMLGKKNSYYCDHYYRNIYTYSFRKLIHEFNLKNIKLFMLGIKRCPYSTGVFLKTLFKKIYKKTMEKK